MMNILTVDLPVCSLFILNLVVMYFSVFLYYDFSYVVGPAKSIV